MLYSTIPASEKRAAFRAALNSGELLRLPGAPQPRHAVPLQPWNVRGWFVAGLWAACALGVAWRSGAGMVTG